MRMYLTAVIFSGASGKLYEFPLVFTDKVVSPYTLWFCAGHDPNAKTQMRGDVNGEL